MLNFKPFSQIWSESHGVKPNPPGEFVLEGDWLVGGNCISTSIVNGESKVYSIITLFIHSSHSTVYKIMRLYRNIFL